MAKIYLAFFMKFTLKCGIILIRWCVIRDLEHDLCNLRENTFFYRR